VGTTSGRVAPGRVGGPAGRATAALRARLTDVVIASPQVVAVTAGAIYATAGGVVALTPLFPREPQVQVLELELLAVAALLTGLSLLRWGRHLPAWSAHALVLLGCGAISAGVWWSGATPTGVALNSFYIFVALDCGLFFTRRAGWVHLAVAVTACLGVMALQSPAAIGAAVITSVTAVVVACGTTWLTQKAASADVDPLTGLANRRRLDAELGAAGERADRSGSPLSVALLDLDRFKAVNDGLGHAAGDRLLVAVTRAWTPLLDAGQLLARQGGDEFVLVLPGLELPAALALVERLRAAMPEGRTCSAGVAQHGDGEGVSALLRRADAALYRVKRDGRDGVAGADALEDPADAQAKANSSGRTTTTAAAHTP